jgi:effector-binding domain-containing protein
LADTYKKIRSWAREYGYDLAGESYERYVTDYWTTCNSSQFVTEVMIKVSRGGKGTPARQESGPDLKNRS